MALRILERVGVSFGMSRQGTCSYCISWTRNTQTYYQCINGNDFVTWSSGGTCANGHLLYPERGLTSAHDVFPMWQLAFQNKSNTFVIVANGKEGFHLTEMCD